MLNLTRRRNNSNSGEQDLINFLRFLHREDCWRTWDTISGSGMIDLPEIIAVFDLQNILVGWTRFAQYEPPSFLWDIDGKAQPRPNREYKRGFSVLVFLEDYGLREICANSISLNEAISGLYDLYDQDPRARQGLLPLVKTGPSKLIEDPRGDYHEPRFELLDWVKRPPGLPVRKAPPPAASAPGTVIARADQDIDDEIPF